MNERHQIKIIGLIKLLSFDIIGVMLWCYWNRIALTEPVQKQEN